MNESLSDVELSAKAANAVKAIKAEVARVIVGQESVINEVLYALFVEGHALLVGVPGLAKTLLVSTLAKTLDFKFGRIQFTPDLMPSDITGTDIIQEDKATRERLFKFMPGPVFANVLLADEINRTPPKTQAALLQAMQERRVTAGGATYDLPRPFFVLATQNPIEQEGTYPLPEAQLDRFLFQINLRYPTAAEEANIVKRTTSDETVTMKPVLSADEVVAIQHLIRRVPVAESLVEKAVSLVRLTRPQEPEALDITKKWLKWGAGPRAAQALVLASKARALLNGHETPSVDDLRALAAPVLRHRLILSFQAESEGHTTDSLITQMLHHL